MHRGRDENVEKVLFYYGTKHLETSLTVKPEPYN